MPKVDLNEALEEWEDAQETERDIQNLLDFGTDDPKRVAELEARLYEDNVSLLEQLLRLRRNEAEDHDPLGLDWEEDDEPHWMDLD
jgi:hypothetical protein